MVKNYFVYICEDCGTAYYNSIAAKCCCTEGCNKTSLSKYICSSGNKNKVRMVIKKNKAALMSRI